MKPLRRNYRMSDAALIQLADDILGSANRDMVDLGPYGVTPVNIVPVLNSRNAFSDYPTDDELMGEIIIATTNRNIKFESAKKRIDDISVKAKFKFGEKSGQYRKFGIDALSQQTPEELLRMGRRVFRVGVAMLIDLDSEGLEQVMLDDLSGDLYDLDNLIDAQKDAIKDRNASAHHRTALGNDLYAKVALLAEKGKQCWKYTNEALYNDYVITERSSPNAQVVDGNVNAGEVVNLSVEDVNVNSEFTLSNTGTSDLNFFFTDSPVSTSETMFVTVPPNTTTILSAQQLGYNQGNSFTLFNVFNAGVSLGSYDVEWS